MKAWHPCENSMKPNTSDNAAVYLAGMPGSQQRGRASHKSSMIKRLARFSRVMAGFSMLGSSLYFHEVTLP